MATTTIITILVAVGGFVVSLSVTLFPILYPNSRRSILRAVFHSGWLLFIVLFGIAAYLAFGSEEGQLMNNRQIVALVFMILCVIGFISSAWWFKSLKSKDIDKQKLMQSTKVSDQIGASKTQPPTAKEIASEVAKVLPKQQNTIIQQQPKPNEKKKQSPQTTPKVYCKIASSTGNPRDAKLDLKTDGKVWFIIMNHEPRQFLVYVSATFILGNSRIPSIDDYGGKKAWHIGPMQNFKAPGLPIPPKIMEKVKLGQRVKIRIDYVVKDENNKPLGKHFPVTFVYDGPNTGWWTEP